MEAHGGCYQNAMVFLKLIQPFLIKMGVTKQEEADKLYHRAMREIAADGVGERRACGIQLPAAQETWVGERDNADDVMSGPYGVYYSVLKGKLGAMVAIATRKLRVRGNLANRLRYTGAINRFVELMQGLDTELEGDAAK